jgi:Tol biopolymer transport system component
LIINDKDNSIVSGEGDLWIYDFGTGNLSRLTFDGGNDYPVWSTEGSTIYFDSSLGQDGSLYAKHADGTGGEQTIIKGEGRPFDPDAMTPNGKIVAFTRPGGSGGDLWTFALGEMASPKLFKSNAAGAVFSPDGNYVAYSSYQGGVYQVFVNTFPDAGGQWQVSQENGVYPKWCGGGRELVYYDQPHNRMMSVDVELKPAFHASAPRELFNLSTAQFSAMQTNPAVNYDVSADCQRFAFLQPSGPAQTSPEMGVTLNFPEEIRALMRK